MEKKLFEFKTKTIVATGLGAALFTLLFMYVKIPTGIPETDIQTAYGIGAFFAALFGPIAGGLISFIGHALSDSVQYGSAWWSWVIASGLTCFITGFVYPRLHVEEGEFGKKDIIQFSQYHFLGNCCSGIGYCNLCRTCKSCIYTGNCCCDHEFHFCRSDRLCITCVI